MISNLDTKTLNVASLKERRKAVQLNQQTFAKLSNKSRKTLINFETSPLSTSSKKPAKATSHKSEDQRKPEPLHKVMRVKR